ncbi:MAG: hypothetical protein PHF17_00875 [Arcobacteraceae bacterium]|nr:hypothetical protein [Arcobacteraceae bacterium]
MRNSNIKNNKKEGFMWSALIGFIAILAIFLMYILPSLKNSTLPAVEMGIKNDLSTFRAAADQYRLLNAGTLTNINFPTLANKGILDTNNILKNDTNAVYLKGAITDIKDYYKAASGIKYKITEYQDRLVIFIDASNNIENSSIDFLKALETNMNGFFIKSGVYHKDTTITEVQQATTAGTGDIQDGKLQVVYF